jgi:hypothetical protein
VSRAAGRRAVHQVEIREAFLVCYFAIFARAAEFAGIKESLTGQPRAFS